MKSLFFGLLAISLATVASAFSDRFIIPTKSNYLTTRYWINNGTNYVLFSGGVPNPLSKCKGISSAPCSIESNDPTIPTIFPLSNLPLYDHVEVIGSTYAYYAP